MPRYIVERTFPDGLTIPSSPEGAQVLQTVAANNAAEQVTWIQSFVTSDRQKTYCVYDGPSPESVRAAASRSGLPVDSIADVTTLDPYAYHGPGA